ncbi:MAG: hypothetical protein IJK31_00455 [Ruminococcus sp.]|nr:hypothetical protein [Ruminococcus sp.]
MMSRISAEFESPDMAEAALSRISKDVTGIYRTGVIYNKISDKAQKLHNGSIFTIIPTAVTTYNYYTASIESPASEDVIPEPHRSRTARGFVICDAASAGKVCSLFYSLGGSKIKSEI